MLRPAPPHVLLFSWAAGLALSACGEVETLESRFTPSLDRFVTRVQPVLDAQTCGRGPNEARGTSGCHTPEQGGLKLIHKPGEEQVVENYRQSVAMIDLADPPASLLLQAPLHGPLPPGQERGVGGAPEVDHPEYAGRFTTTDDCCYCQILLWICGDLQGNAGCDACRSRASCQECRPVIECLAGGAPERGEENTQAYAEAETILVQKCGRVSCHAAGAVPPSLYDAATIRTMVGDPTYLTPCAALGLFLQYVDGFNNDPLHASALDAGERGKLHVWVEELGAPTCPPEGCVSCPRAPLTYTYQGFVAGIMADNCNLCHGSSGDYSTSSYGDLFGNGTDGEANLVACQNTGVFLDYCCGSSAVGLHDIITAEDRARLIEWVTLDGAAER